MCYGCLGRQIHSISTCDNLKVIYEKENMKGFQCEIVIQKKWFVMKPKATPPLPTPMYHRIFNSSYPPHVLFVLYIILKDECYKICLHGKGQKSIFCFDKWAKFIAKKKGEKIKTWKRPSLVCRCQTR